jgi:hypothetical protein
MTTPPHPDRVKFDRAVAESTLQEIAAEVGLTAAVVVLPEPDEVDDDGQIWFDDYDVRVDTTGHSREPATIWIRNVPRDVDQVERHAIALLAAVAAARAKTAT